MMFLIGPVSSFELRPWLSTPAYRTISIDPLLNKLEAVTSRGGTPALISSVLSLDTTGPCNVCAGTR